MLKFSRPGTGDLVEDNGDDGLGESAQSGLVERGKSGQVKDSKSGHFDKLSTVEETDAAIVIFLTDPKKSTDLQEELVGRFSLDKACNVEKARGRLPGAIIDRVMTDSFAASRSWPGDG